jgi:hypothetical protein
VISGIQEAWRPASAMKDLYEFSRGWQLLIGRFILFLGHPLQILEIDIHSVFLERIAPQNDSLFGHSPLAELTSYFKRNYRFSWDIAALAVFG